MNVQMDCLMRGVCVCVRGSVRERAVVGVGRNITLSMLMLSLN